MVHKLKQMWFSQFHMLSGLTQHHTAVRFRGSFVGVWEIANNVSMEPAGSESFVV